MKPILVISHIVWQLVARLVRCLVSRLFYAFSSHSLCRLLRRPVKPTNVGDLSLKIGSIRQHTHTHTHTHVYIYKHYRHRICGGQIYKYIYRQTQSFGSLKEYNMINDNQVQTMFSLVRLLFSSSSFFYMVQFGSFDFMVVFWGWWVSVREGEGTIKVCVYTRAHH